MGSSKLKIELWNMSGGLSGKQLMMRQTTRVSDSCIGFPGCSGEVVETIHYTTEYRELLTAGHLIIWEFFIGGWNWSNVFDILFRN